MKVLKCYEWLSTALETALNGSERLQQLDAGHPQLPEMDWHSSERLAWLDARTDKIPVKASLSQRACLWLGRTKVDAHFNARSLVIPREA